MVMQVIKKCPNCNNVIYDGHDQVGIDIPFKICGRCKTKVIDKSFTEWELKKYVQKISYFFVMVWTSFFIGLLLPIIFIGAYEEGLSSYKVSGEMMFVLWAVGSFLVALKSISNLKRDIKSSKSRMEDPKYRNTLKELGLL